MLYIFFRVNRSKKDWKRIGAQSQLIKKRVKSEIDAIYPYRKGCRLK